MADGQLVRGSADGRRAVRQLFEPPANQGRSNLFPTQRRTTLLGSVHTPSTQPPSEIANLACPGREALGELGTDLRLHLFRNNLTQGNGCHENYLLHRRRDFRQVADVLSFFRDPLQGNGNNTGAATPRLHSNAPTRWDAARRRPPLAPDYQHTTRPWSTRVPTDACTSLSDNESPSRRRLPKVGMTNLIHIEDGLQIEDLALADPMRAIRGDQRGSDRPAAIELASGRTHLRGCSERFASASSPVFRRRAGPGGAYVSTCGAEV